MTIFPDIIVGMFTLLLFQLVLKIYFSHKKRKHITQHILNELSAKEFILSESFSLRFGVDIEWLEMLLYDLEEHGYITIERLPSETRALSVLNSWACNFKISLPV